MPFAINEATRFISPTKTPEYLAAARPVVSTPVFDVVRHYGNTKGVLIADGASEFVSACERALVLSSNPGAWLPDVDTVLAQSSWDETFRQDGIARRSCGPEENAGGFSTRPSCQQIAGTAEGPKQPI